ncbi:Ger(x)C family spore germination protein, partial [Lysinibacillus sp.]
MPIIKHTLSFILLLFIILLLGGCWSKRELNELAIVTAFGVDKSEELVEISVQIVNPSQVASNKASSFQVPVFTYHAKGKSLFDAMRKLTTLTPRKPYYSHAQIIIIGEEMAKEGMNSILDLLQRDPEGRSEFNIIIAHESTAQEILSILTPLEDIPASKLFKSLKDTEATWGTTESVILDDLVQSLGHIDNSAVLPNIQIHGDADAGKSSSNVEKIKSPAQLQYGGLAV